VLSVIGVKNYRNKVLGIIRVKNRLHVIGVGC
jgi:hypothetical protein